jgi:hypothetical protein
MFNNFTENRVVYEIMWINVVKPESHRRQYNMVRAHTRTHSKAPANPHTQAYTQRNTYLFPTGKMLPERASVLRSTCIAPPVSVFLQQHIQLVYHESTFSVLYLGVAATFLDSHMLRQKSMYERNVIKSNVGNYCAANVGN